MSTRKQVASTNAESILPIILTVLKKAGQGRVKQTCRQAKVGDACGGECMSFWIVSWLCNTKVVPSVTTLLPNNALASTTPRLFMPTGHVHARKLITAASSSVSKCGGKSPHQPPVSLSQPRRLLGSNAQQVALMQRQHANASPAAPASVASIPLNEASDSFHFRAAWTMGIATAAIGTHTHTH